MSRAPHQTPEYIEAEFADEAPGPLPPPSDGLLATIRAAYDEARRLEARRYGLDLIAGRRQA